MKKTEISCRSPDEQPFPFHYGEESQQYTFYRIPKALFTSERLKGLSTDAKLLYGLMLDRMQLSIKNKWMDDEGKVFIYFRVESIMEILGCGNNKAIRLLAELDDKNGGVGLISRVRQGMCAPDRIYVHKCVVSKVHEPLCQNNTSSCVKTTSPVMAKQHPSNNKIKDTEIQLDQESENVSSGIGYYQNVYMTAEELKQLQSSFSDWKEYVEKLSSYMASTGKQYRNHAATIRSWALRDKKVAQTRVYECKEGDSL